MGLKITSRPVDLSVHRDIFLVEIIYFYVDFSERSTKPMSPSRDGNQVVAKQHGNGPLSVFREYGMGVFRFVASI